MRQTYRVAAAAAVTVLVVVGLVVNPATGQAAEPKTRPPAGPGHTITLITGDQVTIGAGDSADTRVTVRPAEGREHMTFQTVRRGGHLSVVPADALGLVRTGRLDARLFDVTAQVGYGYDRRADLPLLVTPAGPALAAAERPAAPAGLRVERNLPAVRGLAGKAKQADLGTVWRDVKANAAGRKVWLDGVRRLAVSGVGQIGAPAAWQAGFDGTGVTVAVIDSGVDAAHPDLAGQVVAEHNFVSDLEDGLDHVGHGTHVASIIAGTGAASNGTYKGVAPGAKLIDAKACASFGCPDSALLDAMNWVAADQHVKVVNMSLGGFDTPETDPLEQAITDLSAQYGTLFVVAAGNDGADRSIESPGDVDAALTVGAIDEHDTLAPFSSRGPRLSDSGLKPDITAPGVTITAALSKDSGGPAGQAYIDHSGTSMATPHVAGAAAILAQHSPALGGAALKATLMASAVPNPATAIYGQGAGRVDVPRSLAATLTTSPPSVSFGLRQWPHNDDQMVTKAVTYHNSGAAATTVSLALQAGNAPAGLFALSASTLTVPAGGDAGVTVTADTRVAGPDGFFGGYLVATAGTATTRTPFAVEKEVESYDVTINHVGPDGQPAADYFDTLFDLTTGALFAPFGEPGVDHVRLPKGRYFLDSLTFATDTLIDQQQPVLEVNKAQTVTVDARAARPITVTVPPADAQQGLAYVLAGVSAGGVGFGAGVISDTFATLRVGPIGDSAFAGYVQQAGGQWAKPSGDGGAVDSPYEYNLSFVRTGRPFDGLTRNVRDRDLAKIRTTYLGQLPSTAGEALAFGTVKRIGFAISNVLVVHPPFTRDEFFSEAKGLTWSTQFIEETPDNPDAPFTVNSTVDTAYRAGHRYERVWNKAVFGPAFPPPHPDVPIYHVARYGDELFADLPLFSANGSDVYGYSTATGTSRLYRDGALVGSGDPQFIDVTGLPAAPARFRLETTAERGAPFTLSTKVSAVWEFTSGHAPEDTGAPIPLSAVRFSPWLDSQNTAPAGHLFVVPVTVQAPIGANRNRSLSVQVSYDDGRTWKAAPVIAGVVVLNHPKTAGFVSLRAKATDVKGNTVEETIIRAYKIA